MEGGRATWSPSSLPIARRPRRSIWKRLAGCACLRFNAMCPGLLPAGESVFSLNEVLRMLETADSGFLSFSLQPCFCRRSCPVSHSLSLTPICKVPAVPRHDQTAVAASYLRNQKFSQPPATHQRAGPPQPSSLIDPLHQLFVRAAAHSSKASSHFLDICGSTRARQLSILSVVPSRPRTALPLGRR